MLNPRILATVFVIVLMIGLLAFSPKGKEFREKHINPFFRSISGRFTNIRIEPSQEKKLDVMVTDILPSQMSGKSFDVKEKDFTGKLSYDSVSVSGLSISLPTNTVEVKTTMTGKISFEGNKIKISGTTDNIVLSGSNYKEPNTEFSISGTPISYVVEVEDDRMAFPGISGHLSWSGLKKEVPLLLENDKLELIGFEGTVNQVEGYASVTGKAEKIKLNGVDITLG